MHDDGKLVNEEVVGRVNDHADVVEMVLTCEVFVCVFILVLTERTCEGRTESGDPTVEGQELFNGGKDGLLVHVRRLVREDAAIVELVEAEDTRCDSLWLLEPLPVVLHAVPNHVAEEVRPVVPAHADLKELVFASIQLLV